MVQTGWEAYDLHVHTSQSSPCADVSAQHQVRTYAELGYKGIVITDHFGRYGMQQHGDNWQQQVDGFLAGYRQARELGETYGLQVFLGAEITLDQYPDDFLLFGADEAFFYQHQWLYTHTLDQLYAISSKNNYFLAQAHPFRSWSVARDPQYMDGAELYNGHASHDHDVPAAVAWMWEHGLIPLSGSDSHHVQSQGQGGICVPAGCENMQQIISHLRQQRYALIVPPGQSGIGPNAK